MTDQKWLIIQPHPDDMELGMGATLHENWSSVGVGYVGLATAFSGDYKRNDGEDLSWDERVQEVGKSLKTLGVEALETYLHWQENIGMNLDMAKAVGDVESLIKAWEPTDVFVSLPSFNQDHQALYEAVITATRPTDNMKPMRLWAYEYPGSCWGTEKPTGGKVYWRVSQTAVDRKVEALRQYKTQFGGRSCCFPYGPEAAENLAERRGFECGYPNAELMYLLREIR